MSNCIFTLTESLSFMNICYILWIILPVSMTMDCEEGYCMLFLCLFKNFLVKKFLDTTSISWPNNTFAKKWTKTFIQQTACSLYYADCLICQYVTLSFCLVFHTHLVYLWIWLIYTTPCFSYLVYYRPEGSSKKLKVEGARNHKSIIWRCKTFEIRFSKSSFVGTK